MPALKLVIHNAGYAALRNAQANGTAPVVIASVGVTATTFVADKLATVLPGEIKRIATIVGGATSANTIHVTVRDSGSDTYSLKGIGVYLADGTLFASYGQATTIVEKSAGATMLLALDAPFADIDTANITVGDTNFDLNQATTEVQGVLELATDAEAIAGVDAVRAVTPKGLLAKLTALLGAGAPSAFVKTLLTAVDVVAFRTLLAIKTAASYDIGVGNGLDADLLDGQHGAYYRSYANLTGVPATFAPSAHTHSAADITSGVLGVLRGGTGVATFAAGSYLVGNGTGAIVVKTPAQVLAEIGAAAVAHSHPTSDIIGLDAALAARPLQTAVTAQISAAVNALINGSPGALDTLQELAAAMGNDANFAATVTNALASCMKLGLPYIGDLNIPTDTSVSSVNGSVNGVAGRSWGNVFTWKGLSSTSAVQIYCPWDYDELHWRRQNNLGAWQAWRQLWHTGNFDPASKAPLASPTFTGTPTAPTAAAGTNNTQLATTAFVQAAIAAALANYLPKNNPTFTGTMTGPAYNKAP